jgi:hypothetical protein
MIKSGIETEPQVKSFIGLVSGPPLLEWIMIKSDIAIEIEIPKVSRRKGNQVSIICINEKK